MWVINKEINIVVEIVKLKGWKNWLRVFFIKVIGKNIAVIV